MVGERVTSITDHDHGLGRRPPWNGPSDFNPRCVSVRFSKILPVLTHKSALAKAGYKVIHVDPNDYYGGDHATLSIDEITCWANLRSASLEGESVTEYLTGQRKKFISISCHGSSPASKQYSLSLLPSIIPSVGPLISALIGSGVSRYGGFKLLEKVAVYRSPGHVQTVPNTKEDIFNNRDISLIDKRRLMRFFTFVSGDFEGKVELRGNESTPFIEFLTSTFTLERSIAETIVFALAFCSSPQGLSSLRSHCYRRLYEQSRRSRP